MTHEPFIIEITLTHDHFMGRPLPAYFQAVHVPMEIDGALDWTEATTVGLPLAFDTLDPTDQGFNEYLMMLADVISGTPERVDFSIERKGGCAICIGQREAELISNRVECH